MAHKGTPIPVVEQSLHMLLVESVKDYAIFMLDAEGVVSSWNPGAERLKGYSAKEILGKRNREFYTPEDQAAGKPEALLARAAADGRVESEGWRVRKDGTRFWADVILSSIRDSAGELLGFAKVTRDLTDRVAMERAERDRAQRDAREEALREHNRRSRFLADASTALSRSLDYRTTLREVAALSLPLLADWVSVVVTNEDGVFECLAVLHHDPTKLEATREYQSLAGPGPQVLRETLESGKPRWMPVVDAALLLPPAIEGPEHVRILRELGVASCIVVPLVCQGVGVGVISFMRSAPGNPYSEDDFALGVDLGGRASLAIGNARLFRSAELERDRAYALAAREEALRDLTMALAGADDPSQVAGRAAAHARRTFGAETVALYSISGDSAAHIVREGAAGFALGREPACIPSGEILAPIVEVMRTGKVLVSGTTVVQPVALKDLPQGAWVLTLPSGRTWTEHDASVADVVSSQTAQAVERARLLQQERRAAERAALLADVSVIFAASRDANEIISRLVRACVPGLGDWCSVEELDGNNVKRVAVFHSDPKKLEGLEALERDYPRRDQDAATLRGVILNQKPVLLRQVTEEMLTLSSRDPVHLGRLRGIGLQSAMVIPLIATDRCIGALTLVWAETPRRYSPEDVEFALDVGRRAALAAETARLNEALAHAVKARDEFISVAAHELRTPLSALMLQVNGLQRRTNDDLTPTLVRNRLEKASRSALRLVQLIEQLLDTTRITAGRLRLEAGPMDLAALVETVASRFIDEAAAASVALNLKLEPAKGEWDELRLDQVVSNLISNAIKFGNRKPVELTVRNDGREAILIVRDSGVGIPEDQQGTIFRRFERAGATRDISGFGLGLWISSQIVEASGGDISVWSKVGLGTQFTVRLPRHES